MTKEDLICLENKYKTLLIANKNLKKQQTSFTTKMERRPFTYIETVEKEKSYVVNECYMPWVKKIKMGEKQEVLFENIRKRKNAKQVIEGILFYFLQEVKTIEELLQEIRDVEEKKLLQEELYRIKEEMKTYREFLKTIHTEEKKDATISIKRNLLFLKSQAGNPFLYSDLKSIASEYYPNFLEVFSSLQQGEIQNLKKVVTTPFWEAKGFATRILFSFEANNSLCLVGAFIKKTNQYNRSIRDLKDARILSYTEQKALIDTTCKQDDLLSEEKTTEKILTLLKGGESHE